MSWDDGPDRDTWFSVDPQGQREEEPGERRRGPSFLSVLLGLVVVAIAVIAWVNRSPEDRSTSTPSTTSSTSVVGPTTTTSDLPGTPSPSGSGSRPTTRAGTGPPLGTTRPWDLLVAGGGTFTRIEMATGRTTQTALTPASDGMNQSMIIDLGDRALVQPLYGGSGQVVADDGSVAGAAGRFPATGLVMPALGTDRLWVSRAIDGTNRLDLLTLQGDVVDGASVDLPLDIYPDAATSDGGLALLVQGTDGSYRVESGRFRRITTGLLLARSAQGWLVQECDVDHQCALYFIDRDSGRRRSLGPALDGPIAGSIAPDGRRAVAFLSNRAGMSAVCIDLSTGARTEVASDSDIAIYSSFTAMGNAAWSPDSRWVVVTTAQSRVIAVEAATGKVSPIPIDGAGDLPVVLARYR